MAKREAHIPFHFLLEIRQKGLREAPTQPLHLYDTPYEPISGGLDVDTDRPACPRPRESRLPEDDERPPEEYDQPWEWKKERISKAFAGELGWRQLSFEKCLLVLCSVLQWESWDGGVSLCISVCQGAMFLFSRACGSQAGWAGNGAALAVCPVPSPAA